MKALSDEGSNLSPTSHIVKDIMSITEALKSHSFSHVRRQDNFVAYALVRRVRSSFP